MKFYILLLLCSLVTLAPIFAENQTKEKTKPVAVKKIEKKAEIDHSKLKHPITPFLWKIEHPNLKKASYCFGTIHLNDPRLTTLHPLAEKAFTSADRVYTEVNFDFAGMLEELRLAMRPDKSTLKDSLGQELYNSLNEEIKAITKGKMDARIFNKLKTHMVAISLQQLENQDPSKPMLDKKLWKRAKKEGKKAAVLEESEVRMAHLDKLTEEEQIQLLDSTLLYLKSMREKNEDINKEFIIDYLEGDFEGIEKAIEYNPEHWGGKDRKALHKKFFKILLDDRNLDMLDNIEKALKNHPDEVHFFAAGTLHFIGKNSVIDLLKKQGYTLTHLK